MNQRYIILDRDDTIVKDEKGYLHKIEDLEFLPHAIEGLQGLVSLGFKLIIITNQAGVARGICSLETIKNFNDEVIKRLNQQGVNILKNYFCPHHPEFTGPCDCRKPKIKLAQQAAKDFDFDLTKTIFIGDKDSDTEFGKNCQGITIRIDIPKYLINIKADYTVKNLAEAYLIIKEQKI